MKKDYSLTLFLLIVLTVVGFCFTMQTQVLTLAIIGIAILLFCAIGWFKFFKRVDHAEKCPSYDSNIDDYDETEADRLINHAHTEY